MPKITFDEFMKELKELEVKAESTEPLMAHIANTLYLFTSQSFEREISPFKEKWKPLANATLKKSKGLKKKLVDKGKLINSIHTLHTQRSASIGTNVPYAAIHQFGGKAGRNKEVYIPARAFLPIDNQGKIPQDLQDEIAELVQEYFLGG